MSDVVVTVPKALWAEWLLEGDLPGQEDWPCFFCRARGTQSLGRFTVPCGVCGGAARQRTGEAEWHFYLGGRPPKLEPGVRCYVVAHGRLRGYAPLTDIEDTHTGFAFVRRGGAVACTIPEPIRGFQGWRRRWWEYADEIPFTDWQTAGVTPSRAR